MHVRSLIIVLDNQVAVGQELRPFKECVNIWFQKDDITFRYIYEIVEKMDWTVNIQFKLKEKKED